MFQPWLEGVCLECIQHWKNCWMFIAEYTFPQTSTQREPSLWFLCQLRTWYLSLHAKKHLPAKVLLLHPFQKVSQNLPGPRISRFCESFPWHLLPHMCLRRVVRFGKSQRVLLKDWPGDGVLFLQTVQINRNFQLLNKSCLKHVWNPLVLKEDIDSQVMKWLLVIPTRINLNFVGKHYPSKDGGLPSEAFW